MALTNGEITALYRKRAGNYDISANLYYLLGFREAKYRTMAVDALAVRPGDHVIEIGCGTGLNFRYVIEQIGATGRLTGVDLTDAMLAQASERVRRNNWTNVDLVRTDAAQYAFPENVAGVISSFAITLIPEFDTIIGKAAAALRPNGRLVILDLKKPDGWPEWVVKAGVAIAKPFGVSLDLAKRKPWVVMKKYFRDVKVTELYGGFAYIAVGEKR